MAGAPAASAAAESRLLRKYEEAKKTIEKQQLMLEGLISSGKANRE